MKRLLMLFFIAAAVAVALLLLFEKKYEPRNWGDWDVLASKAPRPEPEIYGKKVEREDYEQWVYWGEEWFRGATFGNERLWTDVVGFMNGAVDVPDGPGWRKEPFFKLVLEAIDELDEVRGNLFSGNGGGYTHDLVVTFPQGSMLDRTFPIPEKLHTGLDVEAGSPWPIGVVPVPASPADRDLPYLFDPAAYSSGPTGIGPVPGSEKYRVGLACALCHYSLDIDWDGKPDLKSAKPNEPTPGSPYLPEHAWAIGNQDIHLGWVFALARNTIAGFETSARPGKTTPAEAREWSNWVRDNYIANYEETKREVDRGLITFPRGYADDTPDGLHNPLQFPSLFTHLNWPFNYDGVMVNASDRNNNVWTVGLDLSQLVALCSDRGGKTAKLAFWEQKGFYSDLTAEQFADIVVYHSPAAQYEATERERLREDILGISDGIPGLLRNDSVVLIRGVPGAVPKDIFESEDNIRFKRIRDAGDFGDDGGKRGPLIGLMGTRVITPPEIRQNYRLADYQAKYRLNPDEFVTEAVSMMLDWVEPPPNLSPLLAKARDGGWVKRGYEEFKNLGCHKCHAGPVLTDNLITPLHTVATDSARAEATKLLQVFLAPQYDPATGVAVSGGVLGFIRNLFSNREFGYKVVTLRNLWGSAPYLHDGGVGVALKPETATAGDDLQALLKRADSDKAYGIAQILDIRESNPASYLRPSAALSLQALLLQSERRKVIEANEQHVYPVPGSKERLPMTALHIHGIGHEYWVDDQLGGDRITALVAFLLALDDDPSQ